MNYFRFLYRNFFIFFSVALLHIGPFTLLTVLCYQLSQCSECYKYGVENDSLLQGGFFWGTHLPCYSQLLKPEFSFKNNVVDLTTKPLKMWNKSLRKNICWHRHLHWSICLTYKVNLIDSSDQVGVSSCYWNVLTNLKFSPNSEKWTSNLDGLKSTVHFLSYTCA
jgi:hypothetical protein